MGTVSLLLVFALFYHEANAGLQDATEETAPIKLHPKSVTACPCSGECMMDMKGVQMSMKNDKLTFQVKMNIKNNTYKDLDGEIALKYCDKDGSNCIKQEPFPINNLCKHLGDKNAMWSPLIDKMKAQKFIPECPIKQGLFELKDVLVDLDQIEKLQPEPGRWYAKLIAKHKKKNMFCMDMEATATAVGLNN